MVSGVVDRKIGRPRGRDAALTVRVVVLKHATNWPTARREKDASHRTCADVTPPCRPWMDVARRDVRGGLDDRNLPAR